MSGQKERPLSRRRTGVRTDVSESGEVGSAEGNRGRCSSTGLREPGPGGRAGSCRILTAASSEAVDRQSGGRSQIRGLQARMVAVHASTAGPLTTGPAPLPRGRLTGGELSRPRVGTSPACAGTTARETLRDLETRGPAPPARGRQPIGAGGEAPDRTNPACAGDDAGLVMDRTSEVGPTPLARGRPGEHVAHAVGPGISPACAGTTLLDLVV